MGSLLTALFRRIMIISSAKLKVQMVKYPAAKCMSCVAWFSICAFFFPSIEFDRDCDYFAIAGVTKKIKVYEYGTVIQDAVDIHYPENEMTCNSKIR